MKILLISSNTETVNMPVFPLGLASVAQSVMNAGHSAEWLDLMTETDITAAVGRKISGFNPDLIGISVRNVDNQSMLNSCFYLNDVREIVRKCKSISNAPVLLGGAGYSLFPESSLEYLEADMGIQGEGEKVITEFLGRFQKKESFSDIPGLYFRDSGLQCKRKYEINLNSMTLPDPSAFPLSGYEGEDFYVPLQTRRGCSLGCSYCSTDTIEGNFIRSRSIESFIQWLVEWVKTGFRRFQFVDNNFNIPPDYAGELCRKMLESCPDIEWRSIIYPGIMDESLASLMAAAGCREVSLGFESGCDEILAGMNKHFRSVDVIETVRILNDSNIRVTGFLLLGGPGETRETVRKSFDFVENLDLHLLKIATGIRIYPHTELKKTAIKKGVISKAENLLFPKFYIEEKLAGWLPDYVRKRTGFHSNWLL